MKINKILPYLAELIQKTQDKAAHMNYGQLWSAFCFIFGYGLLSMRLSNPIPAIFACLGSLGLGILKDKYIDVKIRKRACCPYDILATWSGCLPWLGFYFWALV